MDPEEVQGENTPGPNPAWDDVLSVIPEELHDQVTTHFQNWDKNAQSAIEKANSQVSEWEPYKPFKEHGITPEEIEQGLRLMHEINNNPQNVYETLGKTYNYSAASSESEEDEEEDPRYSELKKGLEAVAQIQLQDLEAKKRAEADAELDKELTELQGKYKDRGELDPDFILAKMVHGKTGEQAAEEYFAIIEKYTKQKPFAPNVLGSSRGGSGLPSQAIDPRKLNNTQTQDLVAKMLAAEFSEGGG